MRLLSLCLLIPACAQVPVSADRLSACKERRQELVDYMRDRNTSCHTDTDCKSLPPEIIGKCGFFQGPSQPLLESLKESATDACRSVPQMLPDCPQMVPACRAGRCEGAPFNASACLEATIPLQEALKGANATCATDAECVGWMTGPTLYAVHRDALAAMEPLTQRYISACGFSGARSREATCVSSRCSPAGNPELIPPQLDLRCVVKAMSPFVPMYKGNVAIRATFFDDGQVNYFSVIEGPDPVSPQMLERLAQCRGKPAMLNGKPKTVTYIFNFNFVPKEE